MLPLRSYHGEWLIVALIAAAALAVANVPSAAVSRIGLANSLLEGRVTIDDYGRETIDRARYEGRYYLDKAPGMSVVAAIPVAVIEAVDPGLTDSDNPRFWDSEGSFVLWAVRALVGGVFFLLGVVLVGRVAEGLVEGTGAVAAVAYGLGTLAHPLAPTLFGHIPAGTLGLAALILASRGGSTRLVAAGLCTGTAVLLEYQAALIVVALLVYTELRYGLRAALVLAAGGLPAAVLLALYNVAAFGSPLRFSYEFVANVYADRQHEGLFGIGMPDAGSFATVLVGARGLLLLSPVVLVAAAGLWLLGRRATGSKRSRPARSRSRFSCSTPATSCRTAACRRVPASWLRVFRSWRSGSARRSRAGLESRSSRPPTQSSR